VIEPPTGNEEDDKFDCENMQWNSSDLGKIPGLYFSFTNHNAFIFTVPVKNCFLYIIDSLICFIDLGFVCKVIHSWIPSITHSVLVSSIFYSTGHMFWIAQFSSNSRGENPKYSQIYPRQTQKF
jgi:hypothetical protein